VSFPPLATRSVRWRPHAGTGLEHLGLTREGDRVVADSVVIGERDGRRYGVRYRLVCDSGWRATRLDLETTDGRSLHLRSEAAGAWTDADGRLLPALDGCVDIDLAGTPFTNTLPIRRLDPSPRDGTIELTMVYVPFDTFVPVTDGQLYRCLEPMALYRYEAADRTFAADLPVDRDGLVLDYPTLFERVDNPQGEPS
jgi:hypothetical protein